MVQTVETDPDKGWRWKTATQFEVKDADEGLVEATIATLNVVDKDGDIIRPGFFGTQKGIPILHAHNWQGLPLGVGEVFERDGLAKIAGQYNLKTQDGRDAFETVKFQGDSQDWSFGFSVKTGGQVMIPPEERHEHDGANRILQAAENGEAGGIVHEVSTVIVGAGVDTGTTAVKDGITAEDKGAIRGHTTGTVTGVWDAGAARRGLPSEAAALRATHAHVDPDGDPDAKSSYTFIHHRTAGGPANLRAASAGIAILNGGRGGSNIPSSSRRGVWSHLAGHLRDGDREPPELRAAPDDDVAIKLVDHVHSVTEQLAVLAYRLAEVKAIRSERGQTLGAATLASLPELKEAADELIAAAVDDSEQSEPEAGTDAAEAGEDPPTDDALLALAALAEARVRGL